MTIGFEVFSEQGNYVLINEKTMNLHFIKKLPLPPAVIDYFQENGGCMKYQYFLSGYYAPEPPLPFFTMPKTTDDLGNTISYAISNIKSLGFGNWLIEIIRGGIPYGGLPDNMFPEVYVFGPANYAPANPNDTHGLIVYMASEPSIATFDSRKRPLTVKGGHTVTLPAIPSNPIGANPKTCSNATGFEALSGSGTTIPSIAKPMFHYSSLAQAERRVETNENRSDCNGFDIFGFCVGEAIVEYWKATAWTFYRGGIAMSLDELTLYPKWIPVHYGCQQEYAEESGFFGISWLFGNSHTDLTGLPPLNNSTINLSSTSVIIGDATPYDYAF